MGEKVKYTDDVLIERLLQSGGGTDINAFECIFHKYYLMVLNFAKGILKDDVVAKDVAQNVFMKLWINRASLVKSRSLKNYICVLARNDSINILKSWHTRALTKMPSFHESFQYGDSVEDILDFIETNERLSDSIEALPPQRRMVFKMSRYECLSNAEIAAQLNLSVRTVEKHLELALKDLHKVIS